MGATMVRGRTFTSRDDDSTPAVAIVNEELAARYWNGDAIGKRLFLGIVFAGSLSFGASQALAAPEQMRYGACELTGNAHLPADPETCSSCPFGGYCDGYSTECICW